MRDLHHVSFVVKGKPTGQPRPRMTAVGGHARSYDPEKAVNYKAFVRMLCIDAMRKSGETDPTPVPGTGFKVRISAAFKPPASWSNKKKDRAIEGEIEATIKPDVDNIAKILMDAINGLIWSDDKMVTDLRVSKGYWTEDEVTMSIEWYEEK